MSDKIRAAAKDILNNPVVCPDGVCTNKLDFCLWCEQKEITRIMGIIESLEKTCLRESEKYNGSIANCQGQRVSHEDYGEEFCPDCGGKIINKEDE